VVGAGDLVDVPKKIAVYYLKSYFLIDLFVVLPLPQVKFFFSSSILYGIFFSSFSRPNACLNLS
jgi:cyclic nucleotide gated channel